MLYVGLDVHSRQSSLCILNQAGGMVNQIRLEGTRAAVVDSGCVCTANSVRGRP